MNKKLKTAAKIGGVYVLCDMCFHFGKAWSIANLKGKYPEVTEEFIEICLNDNMLKELSISKRIRCKFIGNCVKILSSKKTES